MKTAIAVVTMGLLSATAWLMNAGAQAPQVTVQITAPENGATVSGPVTIKLVATGVRIAPASDESRGTAHHHLFVDRDLRWLSDTIPQGSPGILHLASGQTEFVLDSLKPGPHRVIALLSHWNHVPLNPLVADTVTFTVR